MKRHHKLGRSAVVTILLVHLVLAGCERHVQSTTTAGPDQSGAHAGAIDYFNREISIIKERMARQDGDSAEHAYRLACLESARQWLISRPASDEVSPRPVWAVLDRDNDEKLFLLVLWLESGFDARSIVLADQKGELVTITHAIRWSDAEKDGRRHTLIRTHTVELLEPDVSGQRAGTGDDRLRRWPSGTVTLRLRGDGTTAASSPINVHLGSTELERVSGRCTQPAE
jgi:hypothetical protein